MGGCIGDTVEADRGLGSRAERVRCFGLKFVRNIFCPEIRPIEALVCVCVFFLPIHSGHQWTYQPGSHRRKVTQDFQSTFLLRCVP